MPSAARHPDRRRAAKRLITICMSPCIWIFQSLKTRRTSFDAAFARARAFSSRAAAIDWRGFESSLTLARSVGGISSIATRRITCRAASMKSGRSSDGYTTYAGREKFRGALQAYEPTVFEIRSGEAHREISGPAVPENVLQAEPADVRGQARFDEVGKVGAVPGVELRPPVGVDVPWAGFSRLPRIG